jgi:putative tryptophan/tyrosine transport system substrate-binding protein
MIRRKAIATLLALGATSAPLLARAQPAKTAPPRIVGYLTLEAAPQPFPTPEQWRQRSASRLLRSAGWDEGRNLRIERAYAGLQAAQLDVLAATLIRKGVEVIVANGPEATLAAARATRTIPIVAFNLVWPEEQGLIRSFARPGRNVTGVALYPGIEASLKRMEIMRELVPSATRLSWLWPADYQQTLDGRAFDMAPSFRSLAMGLGFELRFHAVRNTKDIDAAFAEMLAGHAQALMASGEYVVHERHRVAALALRHRLPSACPSAELVEAGGLFSYALGHSELLALYERTFEYVDRILRGARPADLPVERPKRYELVINRQTAEALGLKVPQPVLLRAANVIG